MAELVVTYDLYKVLNLDRAWDCKTIKKNVLQEQSLWVKRSGSTNDTNQLMLIEERLKLIEEGMKHLFKEAKRKLYDEALDKAYKAGKISNEEEEKLKDILAQAKAYYRKGNIKMASKLAQEAIDGQIGDASAYDILARCHFDSNNPKRALEVIDQGSKVFSDDLDLVWLGARIATIGTQDYNDAQRRINVLLEKAPNNAIGHSEQVYLHLHKGEDQLAFSEIDSYIAAHPNDTNFKKNVSHDMAAYARNACYYHAQDGGTYIADKEGYQRNLELCTKAEAIHKDEYTSRMLENAHYFGQKEWNNWNSESIKSLSLYGAIFFVLGLAAQASVFTVLGLFMLAVDALVIYFSFRPYWQINKTHVTGEMGVLETIVSKFGDIVGRFGSWLLRFMWNALIALIKFVIWICTGGPFR